tara:strand:- start:3184 stop:3930 length:747 start_codon:yes stop_codon:yes gene_type:complete
MNIHYKINDIDNINNDTNDFYKQLKLMQEESENKVINEEKEEDEKKKKKKKEDDEKENNDTKSGNNICLITQETLQKNHITLKCNHSFNYDAIFKEICNQKLNKSHRDIIRLSKKQIKCPYCRSVQTGLLPRIQPFPAIYGVNYPKSMIMKFNVCKYTLKSGKRKNQKCGLQCTFGYCNKHKKIMDNKTCIVIIDSNSETNTVCNYKFKKGKYKNTFCKCKKKFKDINNKNYCKTHYKQSMNKNHLKS